MNNPSHHRSWILGIRGRAAGTALALAIMLVPTVLATRSAQAQTYTTLHSFDNTDGSEPYAGLVQATDGNFYGTTAAGGANGNYGTVFKIAPNGTLTTLYSFCSQSGCADGTDPFAPLIQATDGNFYGTTEGGGANGFGTVFQITPTGTLTTLHSFCYPSDCTDGLGPSAPLVQATDGNFYGTTTAGGAFTQSLHGYGTVFQITPNGTLTTLYSFCSQSGCPDGAVPVAGLVQATDGNFYGTTDGGGAYNYGTVFQITPNGTLTTLYSFCTKSGCTDGTNPFAGPLIQATDGNFYGLTNGGGNGNGTVFQITPSGTLTTLHSFCSASFCTDGADPQAPTALVQATDGNFYGTTSAGGTGGVSGGGGTVFKITASGTLTTLYSFCSQSGCADGLSPTAGLVQATDGNFHGTTVYGGTSSSSSACGGIGCGTVFKLSVAATTTTTALTSSPNPSTYGQAVIFIAAVTSSAGAPPNGETVTFMNGTTVLGTGALSGGSASFTTSTLPVGTNAVTAVYSGDTNFLTSTGTLSGGQIVTSASAGIGVASSQNPSVFGQSVTFTATISGEYGLVKGRSRALIKGGVQPQDVSGTVAWSTNTGCGTTSVTSGNPGTATCTTSILAVGTDTITATYSGDSNHSGGTGTLSGGQTVNQASTTLALTSSVNPSGLDQPVTFTAAISPQYSGQASGTVSFKDGATTLGSTTVSGNAASLTTSSLAVGTHSISAGYSGDINFTGSTSNTLSQVVTTVKTATTTTLVSSRNPSVSGKPVTFTALVSSSAGTPTGKIEFLNGTTVLATVTLKSGAAKYTTSQLPPGSNTITAVYSGDSNHSGSTSPAVDQVVQAPTTTTITSLPNPSVYGQAVILTATVTATIGAPPDGEAVTFKQGSTLLGTGTLSGGTATLSTSTLGVGEKKVTAVYGGDANFTSSKSEILSQVVGEAATTTTLTSSLNPSNFGQSVTFTATVAPQFSGTPTGKVAFYDGTTLLKTVALSGGVAKYTTSKLTADTHNITATYNGSTSFIGSSASLTQTVN
jgi:uncharacterized repeat protein (TIGR03803 family)